MTTNDVVVNGTPVRFRGRFSPYMPPLAYTIYATMRERRQEKMFVADLIRAIGDCEDAFPARSTPYAKYMRIARLLADPVQVADHVLHQEREAGVSRYKKNARVHCRPGVLPETTGPRLTVAPMAANHAVGHFAGLAAALPPAAHAQAYAPLVVPASSSALHERLQALESSWRSVSDRLAALELAMMDGVAPLPADAAADLARVETEFKKRTFDLGVAQNRILARLERLDPQPLVVA